MKICPFISHLLGDEMPDALTIDESGGEQPRTSDDSGDGSNVVILGYDEAKAGKQTQTMTKNRSRVVAPTHLHCLKEPCRFYKKDTGDCQFDLMFTMLKEQDKPGSGKSPSKIAKDIEKIWQFQTKSVAELIASMGESEKKQEEALSQFKRDLSKDVKELLGKVENSSLDSIRGDLAKLNDLLRDREEGIDNLSTTVSELIIHLEGSFAKLQEKAENVFKEVDKLKDAFPKDVRIKKMVEDVITARLKQISSPDLTTELRLLEKRLEETMKNKEAPTQDLKRKLEDALKTQKEIETKFSHWSVEINDKIKDLKSQQTNWDKRLHDIAEHQNDVMGFIEDGKKRQEAEQLQQNKKEAKKLNNLGVTSFHNGAFEMARDQFLQAVELDPQFSEAFNNLGLACTELGDEEKATEAFTKAVRLNPDLPAAYNNLGYIFYKKGSYEQAIEMYNEALGRSVNNTSAYTNLGNAYYKLGNLDKAREAWSKALELDPGNEKARRNLKRLDEMKS